MSNQQIHINAKVFKDSDDFFATMEVSKNIEPSILHNVFPAIINYKDVILPARRHSNYNLDLLDKVNFRLNNFGHRSADFLELNNNKVNILFAGCSETFGESLPEKHSWPYYVMHELKRYNVDLGSEQILSFPGGSMSRIVRNIFKYVDKFGKPDYILLFAPDFARSEMYNLENKVHEIKNNTDISNIYKDVSYNILYDLLSNYCQQYELLRIFCKTNNIKLLSTSWHNESAGIMNKMHPETFRNIYAEDFLNCYGSENFDEDYLNTLDKDFLTSAADNLHSGTIFHISVGKFFAEWIKKYV